jgi:hypothetical protein
MDEYAGSPRTWPPLGLPKGSVRALLTLTVVAVVVTDLARGQDTDVLWKQTLLVALAHYFATRRIVALPGDVIERLEQERVIEQERHPLFLPRYSIRLIIVAAFVGVAVYLYRERKLFEPRTVSLLGIVFAYLFGTLVRGVTHWLHRRRTTPPHHLWADLRALAVLGTLAVVAIPEFVVPAPYHVPHQMLEVALGLVLFYFGVR